MKTFSQVAFILMLALFPSIAHAATTCEAVTYYDKLNQKFDTGARNFLTGWTGMVTGPADYSQKNKYWGPFAGFGVGVVNAVANTCSGFVNMATAPAPNFSTPYSDGGVSQKRLTLSDINRCDTSNWSAIPEPGVQAVERERAPVSAAPGY